MFDLGRMAVPRSEIARVDTDRLERGTAVVWTHSHGFFCLRGQAALDLVWRLSPRSLEGRRLRWARRAWAFHNLVAHPVMQLLAFVGLGAHGVRLHDATIPRPEGVHEGLRDRSR